MKIASFNVNSLRARLPIVLNWLEKHAPDVLCLQETKVQDHDFPAQAFDGCGYKFAFKGQKSYNGVAIFSKSTLENVSFGLDTEPSDQPRLVKAKIGSINIVNTYIPQGQDPESEKFEYKLNWFKRLKKYFRKNFKPTDLVIWVGDFNIAPTDIDVYDPKGLFGHVCFCAEVQQALEDVMEFGFVDVFRKHCPEPNQYTFWDYRLPGALKANRGWRLDHIMATEPLAKKSTACYIDKEPRTEEKPSDHTPIIAEFKL